MHITKMSQIIIGSSILIPWMTALNEHGYARKCSLTINVYFKSGMFVIEFIESKDSTSTNKSIPCALTTVNY